MHADPARRPPMLQEVTAQAFFAPGDCVRIIAAMSQLQAPAEDSFNKLEGSLGYLGLCLPPTLEWLSGRR